MKNLLLLLSCLMLTLSLGCNKEANTLSEKEIISIATKKLNEPKIIKVIGYDPNALVKRSFASTDEGWHKVVFTDTLHGIDLHVLVSPEGFTEISFDPKPGIQPDNNQIVTP